MHFYEMLSNLLPHLAGLEVVAASSVLVCGRRKALGPH